MVSYRGTFKSKIIRVSQLLQGGGHLFEQIGGHLSERYSQK